MTTRVLVTGAGGFIGRVLCPMLAEAGYLIRAAVRTEMPSTPGVGENVVVGDIGGGTDWTEALRGVELVVHLAARVHVTDEAAEEPRGYFETNARGTGRLAAESVRSGVRCFVYLSSVKVNGEGTPGHAYSATDVPHPLDAYGCSKWQGESLLAEAAGRNGMQTAVVRAPLVYGAGVRANFLRLLHWVDRGRWVPLGMIRNQRSLVSVWNLCDLLARLIDHPACSGRTWMVSDGQDVSTPELIRRIAAAMGRRPRLLPMPRALLIGAGALLGKTREMRRLCDSLTVDIRPTLKQLGWSPPLSLDESLARTVSWYLGTKPELRA
jgi:UDP-N-acetyl-alpha-D-quinovosamine dehydrogenase